MTPSVAGTGPLACPHETKCVISFMLLVITDEEIERIARTYHAWRGEEGAGEYKDIPGFCKSATIEEIREHDYILTPGRYVGVEVQEEDDEVFEEKMKRLVAELEAQMAEAEKLDKAIWRNLKELGFS